MRDEIFSHEFRKGVGAGVGVVLVVLVRVVWEVGRPLVVFVFLIYDGDF